MATVERGLRGRRHEDGSVRPGEATAGPRGGLPLTAAVALCGALLAWLLGGLGFANYDTAYALVWGDDLLHGRLPDYEVGLAPTPHPLSELLGLVLAPLDGAAAEDVVAVLALLGLGALGAVVFRLGEAWFGTAAGLLAAAIVLTRVPVLSFGVRAYVDLPYVALVLGAVLLWVRRASVAHGQGASPAAGLAAVRAGGVAPLVLLGLAGLLRPEAWLLAGMFWLLALRAPLRLLPLVVAAPLVWALSDLLVTGDPLWSLTGTQDNAEVLQRRTGLAAAVELAPRRLGEILRADVLGGAVLGALLITLAARDRALQVGGTLAVLLVAFGCLAIAGLPVLGRYLLAPACLLAILCGGALAGWATRAKGDRLKRPWIAAALLTAVAVVALAPQQAQRLRVNHRTLGFQRDVTLDLRTVADRLPRGCTPVAVPNQRPRPQLALYTGLSPRQIRSAADREPRRGAYVDPASKRVERVFTLDPNDPGRFGAEVPPPAGFRERARTPAWVLLTRCP